MVRAGGRTERGVRTESARAGSETADRDDDEGGGGGENQSDEDERGRARVVGTREAVPTDYSTEDGWKLAIDIVPTVNEGEDVNAVVSQAFILAAESGLKTHTKKDGNADFVRHFR